MSILTIRERHATENGFAATVTIDGQGEYPIEIRDPFDAKQERELEFYFEEWIQFPFDGQVKAQRAAASITAYGEALFEQVFGQRKAYSAYERACQAGMSNLEVEIISDSPEFQAFHWEALKDPDLAEPLAVSGVMTRKRANAKVQTVNLKPSPMINLLVVTARPGEEQDVGYRTISRPLIDAIRQAKLRVNVELLRPGTFEALEHHLSDQGKEGYYHIVHFDLHGGLLTYAQFQNGIENNRYVFKPHCRQTEIEPYEGWQAFLCFETDEKGKTNLVLAEDLAELLKTKGIPICILNACQSGKQIKVEGDVEPDAHETSLGSRLMVAGVQMVVAMGYTITVTAAALMMKTLYGELFAQRGIPEAIRQGRRALYNDRQRRLYFNQLKPLEDWLLPVVYGNRAVDLQLREMGLEEEETYFEALAALESRYDFAAPTYGFIGRDLEILKIEKALLRHNVLLLRGMGGTGKTTLLRYLWRWWLTTRFVEDGFYFGYDKQAYTVAQIVHELGKQVYGRAEAARFLAMSEAAQQRKLAQTLRERRYALILDNLESVTGQALAIQNTLPEAEQRKLAQFLQQVRGGKTFVVLGSRSGEDWLAAAFTVNGRRQVYDLRGLDQEARTVLAEKILGQQRLAGLRDDRAFGRLMDLLAGYPLAMEVVLANLARQTPEAVLAALDAAGVEDLDVGGTARTDNILKCVEYSHSNLSPEAQRLLICLAPFNGFIDRADLANYGKQLQRLEPFAEYDFAGFDAAVEEAVHWGLLSPISAEMPRLLTIQPIFPYFLRTKVQGLDEATREALRDGFRAHYQGLAGQYQQLMASKNPQERQLGLFFCKLEYENLYSALKICLEKETEDFLSIYVCLNTYLETVGNKNEQFELAKSVYAQLEAYKPENRTSQIELNSLGILDLIALGYYNTQNYPEAEAAYRKTLKLFQGLQEPPDHVKQTLIAGTYHQLGSVAQALRDYEQARSHYQQALDIFIEFKDRHNQARTYHQLGIVAQEQRDYEQARSHFQQALDICIEFNDRYSQASTYHQLGSVAQEQRDYEQARSHFQQALDIFIEFNDRYSQARTYHQLGRVAEEQRDYEQARSHYQQALDINIEFNDRYSQASTYFQLGRVAEEQRDYEQARSHYQQALDLKIEFNDRYSQASTYHQLGIVAQELRDYEQARSHYQQALDLKIEFNDRYSQASTYHQLGIVAQELRDYEQARSHYQQALDIDIEFNNRHGQASTYHQLGRVAEEQRDYEQARSHYQQALDIFIEFNDRYEQAGTYHQLGRVAQELRDYEQARSHYQQALDIFIEFNDRYSQARTYHQLGRVAQAQRDYEQARSHYQQALDLKIEFNDRYSQASTYSQLGLLAEELQEFEQAVSHHLQDLQISVEFNDERRIAFVFGNLVRLHQTTQDDSILTTIAEALGGTVEQVQELFAQFAED